MNNEVTTASMILLVVSLTTAIETAPAVQSLADVSLPAQRPMVARDITLFEDLQRMLDASGVPYGLEQIPTLRDAAPIDLGAAAERTDNLSGLALRAALDRVVRMDPRYEWAEREGRIVVRAAVARGVSALDWRLPPLELRNATLSDAVGAVARAIDPARPPGGIMTGGLAMTVAPADGAPVTAPEPRITLSVGEGTLAGALDTIARAAEGSWVVRYDGPGVEREGVGLTLTTGRGLAAALPSRSVGASRDPAARTRVRIPVGPTVASTLGIYAQRMHVPVGLEMPLEPANAVRRSGGGMVDLTGMLAANAIDQIVRLDSRLTWSDSGGIYSVRPRPDLAAGSVLDGAVDSFAVEAEPVEMVLDRVATLFKGRVSGRGSGSGGVPGADPAKDDSRARSVSVNLAATTIRGVLDAVCRAHGALMWSVHPIEQPTGSGILVTVQFTTWDGWSVSRSIQLSR